MASGATEGKIGRLQQGIAERRKRLLRAAGELIEERDDGIFSMPELAKRAGLSLATPYNLFGSKAAVLVELFDGQVRGFNRTHEWMAGTSPLERVVGVVDRVVDAFSRRPRFFRNIRKALFGLGPVEQGRFPVPPSGHVVQPLARSLAADGYLPPAIPVQVLEATLMRVFDATFEQWSIQDWEMERLRAELSASFALVCAALLTEADRPGFAALMQRAGAVTPV